jgi:hypothetical protein
VKAIRYYKYGPPDVLELEDVEGATCLGGARATRCRPGYSRSVS